MFGLYVVLMVMMCDLCSGLFMVFSAIVICDVMCVGML